MERHFFFFLFFFVLSSSLHAQCGPQLTTLSSRPEPGGTSMAQCVKCPTSLSSGHDLPVRGFEPRVGLCAGGSEPGACFTFCASFSLCSSPACALSLCLSKINKCLNFFLIYPGLSSIVLQIVQDPCDYQCNHKCPNKRNARVSVSEK